MRGFYFKFLAGSFAPFESETKTYTTEGFELRVNYHTAHLAYGLVENKNVPCIIQKFENSEEPARCIVYGAIIGASVEDEKTVHYLVSNSQLTWIRNDIHHLKNVPGVISIKTQKENVTTDRFLFGRILYEKEEIVGRVFAHENDEYHFLMYDDEESSDPGEQVRMKSTGFQVLVCGPVKEAPCGKLRKNFHG